MICVLFVCRCHGKLNIESRKIDLCVRTCLELVFYPANHVGVHKEYKCVDSV